MTPYRCWAGVASGEHVARAVDGGFFQVNHGKEAPLRRIARGDRVVYYSPRTGMRAGEMLQAFTALGTVIDDAPYQAAQSETFRPFRRNVSYDRAGFASIRPLLDRLSFSRGGQAWGQVLRRGLFAIEQADHDLIRQAMSEATLIQEG